VLLVLLVRSPILTVFVTALLGAIGAVLGRHMLQMSRRFGRMCEQGTVALVNHMGRYFSGRNEIDAGPTREWFRQEAEVISTDLGNARARFNFITLMPRLAFDAAIGAALVLVVAMGVAGIGMIDQSDLALGLAGALKLAPYLSSIVAILMQLGFSRSIVEAYYRAGDWAVAPGFERQFHAEFYKQGDRVMGMIGIGPDRIPVHAGEVVVIRGRSGSGKTTLAEFLCDVIRGRAASVAPRRPGTDKLEMAYCSQFPAVLPTSLSENLVAGGALSGAVSCLVERYGLRHLADESVLNEVSLSGGERQRIGLIRTFSRPLDIAILDEPTASVGDLYRGTVLDDVLCLARRGTLVIVVTHDAGFDAVASRLVEL
jgi:ABC-type transport system involved in cytochrome bd biosynthesis fused ATPase/permease subunit